MRRGEATAKRYARALFLLAREQGAEEATAEELARARELIFAHPDLMGFLRRPWIKGQAKKSVVAAAAGEARSSALVGDFLGLVAVRGRLDLLPEIASVYRRFVDEARGRVRAQVRSAVALTESERQAIATKLRRVVGKEVLVEDRVDPTLSGGFVAQIDSLVLDASLDGQLARLRERLVRG